MKTLIIVAFFALFPLSLIAQAADNVQAYIPEKDAQGKDVNWWPTPDSLIKAMLEMANVVPGDTLIDLGSGDGRIVIGAAKQGAYGIGLEYDNRLVELSVSRAAQEGISERAVFINTDLFEFNLSSGTIISMYLLPELNLRLRPQLLMLKPGTRIVSNTFDMGNWEPDDKVTIDYVEEEISGNSQIRYFKSWHAFLWIVPVHIEGSWITDEGELQFEQHFQRISGTFRTATTNTDIKAGNLRGNVISFEIDNQLFTANISDHQMTGTITSDNINRKWSAIRSANKN